ncbi:unnamed protein product [Timema podura]|uniref:Uncharacterized protein n=1 Tax=Timema podura TaxID=61482 RepID=A0ABN7NL47_TIMPD|nr:unnamed protein product [Timema podura]
MNKTLLTRPTRKSPELFQVLVSIVTRLCPQIMKRGAKERFCAAPPLMIDLSYPWTLTAPVSLLELETVDVGAGQGSRPARSNPVNMPLNAGARPIVPVLIESGSSSSYEQSPTLLEYKGDGGDSDGSAGPGESQLKEDLADAMMESPGITTRDTGLQSTKDGLKRYNYQCNTVSVTKNFIKKGRRAHKLYVAGLKEEEN